MQNISDLDDRPEFNLNHRHDYDSSVTYNEGRNLRVKTMEQRSKPLKTKSAFDQSFTMSRSLPPFYAFTEGGKLDPGCSMDVYELLCRSQAQEQKLAELQRRLLGPGLGGVHGNLNTTSSSSDHSVSKGQGPYLDLETKSVSVRQRAEAKRKCKFSSDCAAVMYVPW